MSGHTYFGNSPQFIRPPAGTIYKYYIPSIDEHIWVCDACRIKNWESILLKKWRLVGREREEGFQCIACAEEEKDLQMETGKVAVKI